MVRRRASAAVGYGLTVADAFVRRQLRGRIERQWHDSGLTTRIAFARVPDPVAARVGG